MSVERNIIVDSIDKKITYISGWSDEYHKDLVKQTESTTPDSPDYYKAFVAIGHLTKDQAKKIVTDYFNARGIKLSGWSKAIHLKHLNECTVIDNYKSKKMEIWSEYNFNGTTSTWVDDDPVNIGENKIQEGFSVYLYTIPFTSTKVFIPYRYVGNELMIMLFNLTVYLHTIIHSNYEKQYRIVNQ